MAKTKANMEKVAWSGRLLAVQPRIRITRSFDERHHSYHGYVLRVDGTCGDETGEFLVAVGKGAHEKQQFRAGMELSGLSVPVDDLRLEVAGFYKTSRIKVDKDADAGLPSAPPFHGVPPDLDTYRRRGHRRLDTKTYESKCSTCMLGAHVLRLHGVNPHFCLLPASMRDRQI
jgi:hypothetical protein